MSDKQQTTPSGRSMQCVIVTPETTVLDMPATFVALPLYDGQRGVAYGHAAFIGRLGAGEVRASGPRDGGQAARFFVQGGFVEVGQNKVTVITQRAVAASALDVGSARAELDRVRSQPAVGREALDARIESADAARAMVRAAQRSK